VLNMIDLFAGCGGLSLGLERAGMRVVGQVEIDRFCRAVLARHWPEVPRHDDVRTALEWWRGEPRPRVDVIAGGYPCQPESTAGKRLGAADERWLWPAMAELVGELRPRYVVGENVMGHRTLGLAAVLADLERLGYVAFAGSLSAFDVGAPHVRQRLFVVARRALPDADGAGRVERDPADRPRPGAGRRVPARDRGWSATPELRRVADGVPRGLDGLTLARLRALGNAVVPRMAEAIGRLVIQDHDGRSPARGHDHRFASDIDRDQGRSSTSIGGQ